MPVCAYGEYKKFSYIGGNRRGGKEKIQKSEYKNKREDRGRTVCEKESRKSKKENKRETEIKRVERVVVISAGGRGGTVVV